MNIIIHSSKTMRQTDNKIHDYQKPPLLDRAIELNKYLRSLSENEISKKMHISNELAAKTILRIKKWNILPKNQLPAIDAFLGDIYSGLSSFNWSEADRNYANNNLFILSGLYGILRPLDSIYPYRLEMGYKFDKEPFNNLYKYWGDSIAKILDNTAETINLSSIEYSKVITDFLDKSNLVTPIFYTQINNKPTFVAVHSKIARGAVASWLVRNRAKSSSELANFNELGYKLDPSLSEKQKPVYVCNKFDGLGLSVRLK